MPISPCWTRTEEMGSSPSPRHCQPALRHQTPEPGREQAIPSFPRENPLRTALQAQECHVLSRFGSSSVSRVVPGLCCGEFPQGSAAGIVEKTTSLGRASRGCLGGLGWWVFRIVGVWDGVCFGKRVFWRMGVWDDGCFGRWVF